MFTDGNKNNHGDSLFQYSCQHVLCIFRDFAVFIDGYNQTVHEDSFIYKYKLS